MPDVTRKAYRELSDDEKAQMLAVKEAGEAFIALIPDSTREFALARTNAEQAVMWAVKGITA